MVITRMSVGRLLFLNFNKPLYNRCHSWNCVQGFWCYIVLTPANCLQKIRTVSTENSNVFTYKLDINTKQACSICRKYFFGSTQKRNFLQADSSPRFCRGIPYHSQCFVYLQHKHEGSSALQ